MVHIFSKMPLSTVYFSSWLMSLWSPNMFFFRSKCEVMWHCLQAVILTSLRGWNTDWAITWDRIRIVKLTCLRMFSHVYFVLNLVLMWRRSDQFICASHCYSDLSLHIKQRQNSIYCLNTAIQWTGFEIWDFVSWSVIDVTVTVTWFSVQNRLMFVQSICVSPAAVLSPTRPNTVRWKQPEASSSGRSGWWTATKQSWRFPSNGENELLISVLSIGGCQLMWVQILRIMGIALMHVEFLVTSFRSVVYS